MNTEEKLLLGVAVVGILALGFTHGKTYQQNIIAPPLVAAAPWYLTYNAPQPVESSGQVAVLSALPQLATSNATTTEPCSTCAMMGAGFGSSY